MSEQLEQWNEECLLEGPSPRFVAVTDRSAEHWLTVVPDDAGDRVVVDGRAFGPYTHVYEDALAVSLAGARAAWPVEEDGSWRVVVDGEPGPLVAETSVQARPVFSPDGRHLAYGASRLRARRGRSPILLYVDGGEQDRLLAAAPIQYASDGRLCYVEQAERAQRVVVDGEPGPWVTSVVEFEDPMGWATPETRPMTPVTFAPDSASFAYASMGRGAATRTTR
jgi:hypothetical protein